MRTTLSALVLLLAISMSSAPAAAGVEFRLEVGPPIAGSFSVAKKVKAVAAVRSLGCEPRTVTITGTAEGVVNGTRQSIALTLTSTDKPGVYVVGREWEQGRWVLALSGTCAERNVVAAAIAPLGPGGPVRDRIKLLTRPVTAADIEDALRGVQALSE